MDYVPRCQCGCLAATWPSSRRSWRRCASRASRPTRLRWSHRNAAVRDDDATELLSAAVSLLQDDLARNDARKAGALRIAWDELREFEVRVDPDLRVKVDGLIGRPPTEVDTAAKADIGLRGLFLRESRLLRHVDAGGRSIAGLFAAADQRQLAQAWLAACIAAEDGRNGQQIAPRRRRSRC